ncbi:MAG: FAD-dependent oxidoreductase [Acidimicrobiales bacterium]
MAEVVIVGGGVAGLGVALALSATDHTVTVIDRDSLPPADSPEAAFAAWQRPGAPQARHSHAFLARLRNLLRDRAPGVLAELLAAGATEIFLTEHPPPALAGMAPQPGDEDLVNIACRRTTFEWVLRNHVLAAGTRLRTAAVSGLVTRTGPDSTTPPHVNGVRLAGGEVVAGDVVVDATGRRSPLPQWLADVGSEPVEEAEESTGIVYSSRFYAVAAGGPAPPLDRLVLGDLGHLKYALFPGDNGTFSITFGVRADDTELRGLLHADPFTLAARALPLRPWLEPGASDPITDVEVMGGLINRARRLAPAGKPVATGIFPVGDSSVCTNPLYGRGCSLALVQAFALADVLAAHPVVDDAASVAFDEATTSEIVPWYQAALAQDQADRADAAAAAAGNEDGGGMAAILRQGLLPAARRDPKVYRAFVRSFNLLDPPGTMMTDPDIVARVMAAWQARDSHGAGADDMGPSRDELLAILRAGN